MLCIICFQTDAIFPPGQTKWILRRKLFRGLFQFIKDGRERVIWYQVLRSPVTPVIALRRTSTSTRSIAHELFAEVLLKYRFGIIQWKMGVVIRGEVCSMKLKSSPEILHVFHSSVTLLPSSAFIIGFLTKWWSLWIGHLLGLDLTIFYHQRNCNSRLCNGTRYMYTLWRIIAG